MENEKPINKSLIIISFVIIVFFTVWDSMVKPVWVDDGEACTYAGVVLLLSPLFVIWFKALWNEIIPRVTSWRKITFIEAAGLMTLACFVMR